MNNGHPSTALQFGAGNITIHMDDPLVNEIIDAYYKVKQSWR
jgi:hypothetical protein